MKKKFRFTERWLARLVPPTDVKQLEFWDSVETGLHVLVYKSGRKTYFFRHKGRRLRLGEVVGEGPAAEKRRRAGLTMSLADAQERARHYRASGGQRVKARSRRLQTVCDVVERWKKERAPELRPRTASEYIRTLELDILPIYGDMSPADLDLDDVIGTMESIGEKPPYGRGSKIQANRTAAHFCAVMGWAMKKRLITANPLSGLSWRYEEQKVTRVYSSREIHDLWADWLMSQGATARLFRLALTTCQRAGELMAMRWDRIDTVAGHKVWVLIDEDTKNKSRHYVPLTGLALEVLHEMHSLTGGGRWVFPHRDDPGRPMVEFGAEVRRCRERTGIEDFKMHCLRRTGASWMGTLGVETGTVADILNHSPGGATSHYVFAQGASPACREAMRLLEEHLREAISTGRQPLSFAAVRS